MKKLALILSLSCLTAACQTVESISEDISNVAIPPAPKMGVTAPGNPNAGDKKGDYRQPQPPAVQEKEIDIRRDFPAYHTSPRFDNQPVPGK
jgi:predicted small secreted protein